MRRPLVAAALAALLAMAAAPSVGAGIAAQNDLSSVLHTLVSLWERGDATAIAAFGAGRGIELEIHGEPLGRVSGRKGAAALRHIFANQETVSVRANQVSLVSGTDNAAFAELTWIVRPRGSALPTRTTVFLGLVREGRSWRVSQVRVLR